MKKREEEYEMLSVLRTYLAVDYRVCCADSSDLPSLTSGDNLNLTAKSMADLRLQGTAFDYGNGTALDNVTYQFLQQVNTLSLKTEGIILPMRSNNFHHTYVYLENYFLVEVMKMFQLELFIMLFPVEHLKKVHAPQNKNIMKDTMNPGEFI